MAFTSCICSVFCVEEGCTGFDISKSDQIWIWGELDLGSQNNTSDESNGINNADSCYEEAVQFSVFAFVTSLFARLSMKFVEWQ